MRDDVIALDAANVLDVYALQKNIFGILVCSKRNTFPCFIRLVTTFSSIQSMQLPSSSCGRLWTSVPQPFFFTRGTP
jgi:hypothetical protein